MGQVIFRHAFFVPLPLTEAQILFAATETNWTHFLPPFLPTEEQMLSISVKIPSESIARHTDERFH